MKPVLQKFVIFSIISIVLFIKFNYSIIITFIVQGLIYGLFLLSLATKDAFYLKNATKEEILLYMADVERCRVKSM